MDAVKFIKERNRMCKTYTPKRCEGCPADNYGGEGVACIMVDKIDAERLVPIVEKWSATHPRKTRRDIILAQWPDATPEKIAPCYITGKCDYLKRCSDCRREFWMQEVE